MKSAGQLVSGPEHKGVGWEGNSQLLTAAHDKMLLPGQPGHTLLGTTEYMHA